MKSAAVYICRQAPVTAVAASARRIQTRQNGRREGKRAREWERDRERSLAANELTARIITLDVTVLYSRTIQ